jgi:uncharacterized protein (TIGR00730 family)
MVKRVCVFCGSSAGLRPAYAEAAKSLARVLADRNIGLVYGGSRIGLMGILADEALAGGAEVIGVIPRALVAKEIAHSGLTDLRVVDSMHERKALMADLSDGFIAMPGGFGTFDEFCEILTWTQLRLQHGPCGLLNVEGYYDLLLQMFDHATREQFIKPDHRRMLIAETTATALVDRLLETSFPVPLATK